MRLVNVDNYSLEEFLEQDIPPYAVLSHKWGPVSDELTYKEVAKDRIDKTKRGLQKLTQACKVAAQYDIKYLWIDTCCIDKRSSAELSEAINSMFQWYSKSKICLAYLEDVESGSGLEELFRNSVWFTRSWTLQELLAPRNVHFYDRFWTRIYDKDSDSELIEEITRIPANVLKGWNSVSVYLVAVRLSWASKRTATRSEDVAYSLMGIFDVNMPPLYGEGVKAFTRLLEEIARRSTDPSFLYWMPEGRARKLLATSPSDFAVVFESRVPMAPSKTPFSLTNIGLEIEGDLIRWQPDTFALILSAQHPGNLNNSLWALILRKSYARSQFMYKIGIAEFDAGNLSMRRTRKITILKDPKPVDEQRDSPDTFRFNIEIGKGVQISPLTIERGMPWSNTWKTWNVTHDNRTVNCVFEPRHNAVARMRCCIEDGNEFWIELSFDFDCRPCALIYHRGNPHPVWKISDAITRSDETICQTDHSLMGNESVFLRSQNSNYICAEMPEFSGIRGYPGWIAMIPPRDALHRNDSEYWTFRIDMQDVVGAIPLLPE